jgi:hypothetical protein
MYAYCVGFRNHQGFRATDRGVRHVSGFPVPIWHQSLHILVVYVMNIIIGGNFVILVGLLLS